MGPGKMIRLIKVKTDSAFKFQNKNFKGLCMMHNNETNVLNKSGEKVVMFY